MSSSQSIRRAARSKRGGSFVREIPATGGGEGSQDVAIAGTPEQLVAVATPCLSVVVTARPANTGKIAVGFSNAVRATADAEIGAPVLSAGQHAAVPISDVSKVWIDASVAGDGVSFSYLTEG